MSTESWVIENLPNSWSVVPINSICDVVRGGSPRPMGDPRYFNGNIPFIKISDVTKSDGFFVENSETKVNSEGAKRSRFLKKGTLILSNSGTICVPVFLGTDACIHDGFVTFESLPEEVDKKYLYYFFKYIRPYILDKHKQGMTQVNLNTTLVGEIDFIFPPTDEQKRIVLKIEELFSELNKGIENLKTAREQLKVYRQAMLKQAFEEFEGRPTSLGELLSYITSGSRGWAEYYSNSGNLFIRAQNLKYDRLDLTESAYVSLPNNAEGTRTKVQQGDLLITITGANVTKSALVEQDLGTAYVSQHVALCRPTKEVFPKFLYWFIIAEAAGRKQLSSFAYGAGKPGLNLDNIKSVQVTLPSYEQQIATVKIIEEKLSLCEALEQDTEQNIELSEALRQSILKKAFSGKLVAQDPNDEPASVLLERIRAEKESPVQQSWLPKANVVVEKESVA